MKIHRSLPCTGVFPGIIITIEAVQNCDPRYNIYDTIYIKFIPSSHVLLFSRRSIYIDLSVSTGVHWHLHANLHNRQ